MKPSSPTPWASLCALAIVVSCSNECTVIPCDLPLAVTVTVTSSTGAAISGAFVQNLPATDSLRCTQAPGATCNVFGEQGVYQLAIGAPGYQLVNRTVNVAAGNNCGCSVKTQHLDIALVPTP
jgi:hypothetical protein